MKKLLTSDGYFLQDIRSKTRSYYFRYTLTVRERLHYIRLSYVILKLGNHNDRTER